MGLAKRVLVPGWWVTLRCYLKYRAKVSPRAEVEITPNLEIGRGTVISSFCKIKSADGPLKIGRNTSIGAGSTLSAFTGGTTIGDDVLIGPNCVIVSSHYRYDRLDVPFRLQGQTSQGVEIGDNVFVGSGTCIVDGAHIGSGVVIAANSRVSGTIPDNAIVEGNPAKVVFVRR